MLKCYPIFGKPIASLGYIHLDLSPQNPALAGIKDMEGLQDHIFGTMAQSKAEVAVGGYLEERRLYEAFPHFNQAGAYRSMHLGLDLWAVAGQPIYAPLPAQVHSFSYLSQAGDYGACIVLEHRWEGKALYALYGHLAKQDLMGLEPGQFLPAGTCFAHLGERHENGQWPPHLHWQLIKDMGDHQGDFPGVCLKEDLGYFSALCPDPNNFLA